MNWDAIGAVGEILGAVAVVITLGYLANQIRIQNRANELGVFEGIMGGFNQWNSMLAADKDLYRLFMKGLNNPEELDDDEAGQFSALFRMFINGTQKIHVAYELGAIDESNWADFAAQAAQLSDTPGGRLWFEGHPPDIHAEYQREIQRHRRETKTIDLSLGRINMQM